MPKPIVCLSEQLRQFMEAFRPCFSKRQWKYFVTVLLGLIECDERRTMTGLLRVVADPISLSGLSRFFNRWSWSATDVADTWMRRFRQRLEVAVPTEPERLKVEQSECTEYPESTVVTGYLSVDDSVHEKPKGRKMGGLGQHFSSTEHHVVSGHCLFTGVYSVQGQRCPLPAQMYRQRAVCEQEGVPFLSKVDMAVGLIEQFAPLPGTRTHLLVDIWYHCSRVRKAAQGRDWDVSGGLKRNRVMRLTAPDGSHQWLKLAEYASRLRPEDWQQVVWPSTQGGQVMYAHLVQTSIRGLGPTLVLVTCHSLEEPRKQVRYWGSTVLELDAQALVDILALRWEVETFFEYAKDLMGSDHYQMMTAQGILRFWTLTTCLLCFLEEQRSRSQEPSGTCGDIRHAVQQTHRINLLHHLMTQVHAGCSIDQLCIQLGLSSS